MTDRFPNFPRTIHALWLAGAVAMALAPAGQAATGYDSGPFVKEIRPLLEKHCFKCHNEEKQKGGVDLTRFKSDEAVLREFKLWRRVVEQVTSQEMPPNDDTGFTQQHGTIVINGLKRTLAELESEHPKFLDPGPSLIRRLSRLEYNNVLRDLTGIELDFAATLGFPQDTTGSAFENIAAALSVPPASLEKYFAGADLVLTKLFGDAALSPETRADEEKKLDGRLRQARKTFFADLPEQPEREAAARFIARFARRAWRRPVTAEDTAPLVKFYDASVAKGETSREALRKALRPIFVAPEFLFRIEEDRTPKNRPAGSRAGAQISEVELASRLSFFLWSSMPDDELLTAAEQAQLSKPEALAAQIKRMLADPKAKALTDAMLIRWLGADKVMEARPSTEFFPTFNNELKRAMREEARAFCNNLRTEDRPVLDLLASDYTFVNADLAKHYGLADASAKGREPQRVALKPEDNRGGVLGMGAILTATSHTFRTSPSQRGRWVLDVLFGTPPPPPPANAGLFKDEKREKEPKDFREKLAQHAKDSNCAGCHRKMDPLGFALDNYNAVGQWRPTSADLDTHGELPTGERFTGAADLRKVLWDRRSEFIRNLIGQTLTFALGRDLDYYDEGQISRIQKAMEKDGDRFSSLILGVVNSYPFRHRRNAESDATPKTTAN